MVSPSDFEENMSVFEHQCLTVLFFFFFWSYSQQIQTANAVISTTTVTVAPPTPTAVSGVQLSVLLSAVTAPQPRSDTGQWTQALTHTETHMDTHRSLFKHCIINETVSVNNHYNNSTLFE